MGGLPTRPTGLAFLGGRNTYTAILSGGKTSMYFVIIPIILLLGLLTIWETSSNKWLTSTREKDHSREQSAELFRGLSTFDRVSDLRIISALGLIASIFSGRVGISSYLSSDFVKSPILPVSCLSCWQRQRCWFQIRLQEYRTSPPGHAGGWWKDSSLRSTHYYN